MRDGRGERRKEVGIGEEEEGVKGRRGGEGGALGRT